MSRRFALSLAALLLLALAFEGYLRVFAPVRFLAPRSEGVQAATDWTGLVHVPSTRPGLHYEVAAHLNLETRGMGIRTNALGLRGPELAPIDTPKLFRIAVIGDSMAFGFGVQQGEDFPAQLERELAAHEPRDGRRFEVLNFGVGGYSTLDEVACLREKALALRPDLVVIAYCLNDPEIAPLQPLQLNFAPTPLWRHSHVLRWLASKRQIRRIARYGQGDYWRALHNPDGPFWPQVAAALDEARELCRVANVPVLLAVLPMLQPPRPWDEYPYADIHAFVVNEAHTRGFEALDVCTALRARPATELIVSPDDNHFNVEGNALVARALAERIFETPRSAGR